MTKANNTAINVTLKATEMAAEMAANDDGMHSV